MRTTIGLDVLAGGIFVLLGVGFLVPALGFGFGSMLRMGAGFFPVVLSVLLMILGLVIVVRGALAPERVSLPNIGPLLRVIVAMTAFAAFMEPLGSYFTLPIVVVVAASASASFNWRSAVVLAAVLTISSDLIFRVALGLPFQQFGPWIGG
jgi:hypothetical protein